MRIDEFSPPSEIDGSFTTEERSRFLGFGFDVITGAISDPIRIRLDEFSTPSNIDGTISATEQTRFMTFGFSSPLRIETVIGWSENHKIHSHISLDKDISSGITLSYILKSFIVDEEE